MKLASEMTIAVCLTMMAASLVVVDAQEAEPPIDADILLKQGSLHLGDAEAPRIGDVAIRDGIIVAVGEFPVGSVKQSLDCTGLVISPGFIDLHNHSDDGVVRNATRAVANYLTQGCTTIVTGNCGAGPVDVKGLLRNTGPAGRRNQRGSPITPGRLAGAGHGV